MHCIMYRVITDVLSRTRKIWSNVSIHWIGYHICKISAISFLHRRCAHVVFICRWCLCRIHIFLAGAGGNGLPGNQCFWNQYCDNHARWGVFYYLLKQTIREFCNKICKAWAQVSWMTLVKSNNAHTILQSYHNLTQQPAHSVIATYGLNRISERAGNRARLIRCQWRCACSCKVQ